MDHLCTEIYSFNLLTEPDMNELLQRIWRTIGPRIHYRIGPRYQFPEGQVIYKGMKTDCSTFRRRLDAADIKALVTKALKEPTSVQHLPDKRGKPNYIVGVF